MVKASNTISLLCFLCSVFSSIFSCNTNREFEGYGIELSWTVCGYNRKDPFIMRSCEKVDGVKVCVSGQPQVQCVFTDNNGEFTLSNVPRNEEVIIELSHESYTTLLVPVKTDNDNMNLSDYARNSGLPKLMWYPPMPLKKDSPCKDKEGTGAIAALALEFLFEDNVLPLPSNERRSIENPDIEEPRIPMMKPVSRMKVSLEDSKIEPIYTTEYGTRPDHEEFDTMEAGIAVFCRVPERTNYYTVAFHLDNDDIDRYYCVLADVMANRLLWGFRTDDPYKIQVPVQAGAETITVIKCYNKKNDPSQN